MAGTSSPEGKAQKIIQRGKGKALNALAAASGRDPALIAKEVAKAAAQKEEEERAKLLAEEKRSKVQASPSGLYDSLSADEQYRFECFRRCAFPSRPIEQFVSRALVDEAQRRCLVRRSVMVGLGASSCDDSNQGHTHEESAAEVTDSSLAENNSNQKTKLRRKRTKKSLMNEESKLRRIAMDQPLPYILGTANGASARKESTVPPLDNLVVPDSASEIVAVVSTLAKCYAQRLVAAARRVADAEEEVKKLQDEDEEKQHQEEEGNEMKPITPLQPYHYMEAYRHRVKAGIDPGFWMLDMIKRSRNETSRMRGAGVTEAAAVGRKNWNSAHLAALAAQDAYDEQLRDDSEQMDEEGKQNMEVDEKQPEEGQRTTTEEKPQQDEQKIDVNEEKMEQEEQKIEIDEKQPEEEQQMEIDREQTTEVEKTSQKENQKAKVEE